MMLASSIAIIISAALLAFLGRHDPKRLRNQTRGKAISARKATLHPGTRRLLGWSMLVPGMVLMAMNQWWAFLIWLGAVCALGWLTTHVFEFRSVR